jgi:alkylresorcinol/alkylpyrone synthase
MKGPNIRAVGIAVPPNRVGQGDLKTFAAKLFAKKLNNLERLLPVFDNACIEGRYLAQPLEWYAADHTFAEANYLYEQVGLDLAEAAARQALSQAEVCPSEIGMVVLVSSTGIATPSLDAKLIQRLGLSANTARVPIWGLGCAGGTVGVARASDMAMAGNGRKTLLVAVELCSLTFQRNDYSKSNLVGAGIFADGAAAVVLEPDGYGPEILGSHSTLFSDSEDVMGWDVIDSGLKVRFSRDIPSIVRRYLPELIEQACQSWNIKTADLVHYVVHPGGAKVLDAYDESLGLPDGTLSLAHEVLRDYGNMSSASILFVLKQFMSSQPPTGELGVMLALGPGFSAEQVLFRW